ncbi:hypothetical protein M3Y99_01679100 [Aphelenchoides fujianensis]|nr:hypothetical protein M3Y99_01679100 [Aphelenchoides fujianensis]
MFIFLILPFLSLGIVAYVLLLTRFWWLMGAYLVWLYFDWNLGERGSRPLACVFITACTNGTGFASKFPGVQPHAASLASQLYYPFRREIVAALGVISASAKGICHVLSRPNGGNAVCLVVGGAEEALDAHPSNYSLVLSKRKGFIKLALREGSSLVPVYSFGENHMFKQVDNPRGSPLREFQSTFKKRVGVSPVSLLGHEHLRRPLRLVAAKESVDHIGSPIHVPKTPEPTQEQIDGLHAKYVAALVDLFETHKHRYDIPEDQHLVIN